MPLPGPEKPAAWAIRKRADFNLKRIQEIEAEIRHDVIAFTTAVAEIVGPEARWFHFGLTSNDVVDTAQDLLIKEASEIVAGDFYAADIVGADEISDAHVQSLQQPFEGNLWRFVKSLGRAPTIS